MRGVPFSDLRAMHEEVRAEIEAGWRELIDRSAFVGGAAVADFERAFAAYCEVPHAVGVGTGTDALRIALQAVGVAPGDGVITVPHTFIATTEAIHQVGAVPVFVDIEPRTYSMDPELVAQYLERECRPEGGVPVERRTGRRMTCLLPVDLYGQAADYDPLLAIAERYGLKLVEDACQAHGARYGGRRCGGFGDAAAFSFYPGKNLGAMGEAGAITTQDATVADRCRVLRDHGSRERYVHIRADGSNARLDAVQAVVLSAKLKRLDVWTAARVAAAAEYRAGFGEESRLVLPDVRPGGTHVYHLYVVLADDRDGLRRSLEQAGVGTGLHYPVPLHLQAAYAGQGWSGGAFPVAEDVAARCLSLPMHPHLTGRDVLHVCQTAVSCLLNSPKAVAGSN